jgi:hypothetical protein
MESFLVDLIDLGVDFWLVFMPGQGLLIRESCHAKEGILRNLATSD